MKFTANEIADILNADSITGNKSLEANQLILQPLFQIVFILISENSKTRQTLLSVCTISV